MSPKKYCIQMPPRGLLCIYSVEGGGSGDGGDKTHKMRTSSASKMRTSMEVAAAAAATVMAAAAAVAVAAAVAEVAAEVEWLRAEVAVTEVVRCTR